MIWFSLVFASALFAAGWIIYTSIHDIMEERISHQLEDSNEAIVRTVDTIAAVSIRNSLRLTALNNLEIVNYLHGKVLKGQISKDQAQKEAEEILLSQEIGVSGYIYVINSAGHLPVHPYPSMRNRDISHHWFAKAQVERRQGYLEYEWKNDDDPSSRLKVLYMTYFEPWDWILSVSGYRSEFNSMLNLDDFQKSMQQSHWFSGGDSYILGKSGEILFHAGAGGGFEAIGQTFDSDMFAKMKTLGTGRLHLTASSRNGGATMDSRLVSFQRLPQYGWIVASAISTENEIGFLDQLRYVIFAILATTLVLVFFLSLYISDKITLPLEKLAVKMNDGPVHDLEIRADENGLGEIGLLARRFNHYLYRLQTSYRKLQSEIDVRIQVEHQLKLFAKVFENALEGITITDAEGTILVVNRAFTEITGYPESEVVGENPRVLKSDRHPPNFYTQMWRSLKESGSWVGEIWNRRKNGEAYPEVLSISSIGDDDGRVTHYVAVFHDITDMKRKEEQIAYQAYHDALTGLPNRSLANDRLEMSILHARRAGNKVGLFFVDLDRFKKINDSLGHAVGDKLLRMVAERLRGSVREEDTVARLGGDEFLIIAVEICSESQLVDMAQRLMHCFADPFLVDRHELHVTASFGITLFPDDGLTTESLIKNADVAMYQAKEYGRNGYSLFTMQMSERAQYRMELERDLRLGIDRGDFAVHFQPKVSSDTGVVHGLEALVRWCKPDGTLVSPADFIPLAEETGLIVALGEFVLAEACRAVRALDAIGLGPLTVAVNLSPVQFIQQNLVERFLAILRENSIEPTRIELEITETTVMTNLKDSVSKLNLLVDEGVSVAIDDFGTGYSSLYYLKNLPIDTLKIDRSFVRDITHDASDSALVETIVMLGRNLELNVVAEGVETIEQLDLLASFGCTQIQGFLYSKPLPLAELLVYLQKRHALGISTLQKTHKQKNEGGYGEIGQQRVEGCSSPLAYQA